MSLFGFYIQVVQTLDEIHAPYMIVGAFGAISYGLNRGTWRMCKPEPRTLDKTCFSCGKI